MFSDGEVEAIVRAKIAKDENPGEQSGGSGHLGHVGFQLQEHSSRPLDDGTIEIIYAYSVSVETEFTYYPDNPPMETSYRKRLVVNANKEIVEEEVLASKSPVPPFLLELDWDQAQIEILEVLSKILSRIEREYGENRAPFKVPPTFRWDTREDGSSQYGCIIELDLAGEGELTYQATEPRDLIERVRDDLTQRFGGTET